MSTLDPNDSFHELIAGLNRNDQEAAKRLYERYITSVIRLASRNLDPRLGARVDAESLAHSVMESFFDGHQNREIEVDSWAALYGFLSKVTIRKALNRNRLHHQKKRNDRVDAQGNKRGAPVSLEEHLAANPEAGPAEIAEINDLIEVAKGRLDGDHRKIIEVFLQNGSKEDTAEQTEFSTRTVERVLEKFKRIISELESE